MAPNASPVSATSAALVRLLGAGPARVSLDGGVLRFGDAEGTPVGGIDSIETRRSWFWTRLTVREGRRCRARHRRARPQRGRAARPGGTRDAARVRRGAGAGTHRTPRPLEPSPRQQPLCAQVSEQRAPGEHRQNRGARRWRPDASPSARAGGRGAGTHPAGRAHRGVRGGEGGGERSLHRRHRSRRGPSGPRRALLAADCRAGGGDRHGRGRHAGARRCGHGQDRRDHWQDRPPRPQPGRPATRDPCARLQPQGRRGDPPAPSGRPRRRPTLPPSTPSGAASSPTSKSLPRSQSWRRTRQC